MAPFPAQEECVRGGFLRAHAGSQPDRAFAVFQDRTQLALREREAAGIKLRRERL